MRRGAIAGWLGALALVACAYPGTRQAWAGSGTSITLPLGPQPRVAGGLQLTVDPEWVQGYGHRPVHLELTSSPPAPFDRTITVELGVGTWGPEPSVAVSVDLHLPAGGKSVTRVVPLPQLSVPQNLSVKTFEGGREIEELKISHSISNGQYWGGDGGVPRTLFIGAKAPDITSFQFLSQPPYLNYGNKLSFTQIKDLFAFTHRKPAALYDQWLFYSGLDLTFLSLDDARDLAAKQPKVWTALGEWTRCGGTLCVYGAGSDWHALAEIEQLLKVPASELEASKAFRGWEASSTLVFDEQVVPAVQANRQAELTEQAAEQPADASAPQPVPQVDLPKAPADAPFVLKRVGFGQVVALAADNPFPGEEASWRWLLSSLAPNSTRWTLRYSAIPDGDNPHFNEFLIGDVGLPPIRSYRVLITLFVIVIGPLNYWLLRRWGRLHLFLFTVPLAALITSAGLLSYALLSDGLVSRLRARSLTHLDQRSGEAASVARLSYYVGLAPSGGLTLPDDTLIVPLQLAPANSGINYRARQMTWDDQQYLTRGWLGSRTPTQYTTARALRTKHRLDFTTAADGKSRAVRNRLGTRVLDLLVSDEDGHWHRAGEIGVDGQAKLTPLASETEIDAATREFLKQFAAYAPALPEAMNAFGARENWFWFGRVYRNYQNESIDPATSLLEDGYGRLKAEIIARSLPPGSYVAIVERPSEIVTGTDGLTETQNIHVIQGRW